MASTIRITANIAKLPGFICCDAIFFDKGRSGLPMTTRIIPILAALSSGVNHKLT